MSVIAFNFTKIAGERKTETLGKVNVNNSTNVTDIREASFGNQKALLFAFRHLTVYQPDYATLTIEGEVIVLSNEKEVKETLEKYKKESFVRADLMQQVLNTILNRASVESLVLARDLNLPAPFKLPRIEVTQKTPVLAQKVEKPATAPAKKKK